MNSERIGYQDHISGAQYLRNTHYYAIVGDEDRGYAFGHFYSDIRFGNIEYAATLDELLSKISLINTNIIWHEYSIL